MLQDDRHHFRFIVSPEDAGDMTDLKAFTRDLAKQMEIADFGTRLDWVAVDHGIPILTSIFSFGGRRRALIS